MALRVALKHWAQGCGSWVLSGALALQAWGSVPTQATNLLNFNVQGVVQELKPDGRTVVIRHQEIPNYMKAMTMPFKARLPHELVGLHKGDAVSFKLHVTEEESWIDEIARSALPPGLNNEVPAVEAVSAESARHPLLDFKFTNELGQKVSLSDFRGQALAITFFFTRCPVPDYCPRLTKNFQEAARKLGSLASGPTNWHFLSVSFDPQFDTVPVLKAYAENYQYDAKHWSFLTGPAEKIAELAKLSDVQIAAEGGLFNHNFRTLIIDATGQLQMSFPIGGNLSDAIVEEILKATAPSNAPSARITVEATQDHAR